MVWVSVQKWEQNMPLTAPDYLQQHRIPSSFPIKSGNNKTQHHPARSHTSFSAVLDKVQGACKEVSKVGKKCLFYANPVPYAAALCRIATAGLPLPVDREDSRESNTFQPDTARSVQMSAPEIGRAAEFETGVAALDKGFERLGQISARYESGTSGISTIGYDYQGGTSYGTYQLSSRAGTMGRFIEYLKSHAPDLAKRLSACGPANTGGIDGRMPREWKRIATENPERLAKLEYDFIKKSHYEEALMRIQELTGVDLSRSSAALKEALWSTAVQHGPRGAAEIISRAISHITRPEGIISDERLIHEIYMNRSRYFKSSTRRIRAALQQRFSDEKRVVLAMLRNSKDVQSV